MLYGLWSENLSNTNKSVTQMSKMTSEYKSQFIPMKLGTCILIYLPNGPLCFQNISYTKNYLWFKAIPFQTE